MWLTCRDLCVESTHPYGGIGTLVPHSRTHADICKSQTAGNDEVLCQFLPSQCISIFNWGFYGELVWQNHIFSAPLLILSDFNQRFCKTLQGHTFDLLPIFFFPCWRTAMLYSSEAFIFFHLWALQKKKWLCCSFFKPLQLPLCSLMSDNSTLGNYSSPSILQPSILRPPLIIRPLDLVLKGNFLC